MFSNSLQVLKISSAIENQLLVFSDLDGSLLDHDTYDWQPAKPALDALRQLEIPLILVSSKTLAELKDYRRELGLNHPIVAENGAAVDIPADYFPNNPQFLKTLATRSELQSIYTRVKAEDAFQCQAFFELGVSGIMRETGLSEPHARRANLRLASEPILWLDSDARATQFIAKMNAHGLRCIMGGRFLHLLGNVGKEEAVRHLLHAYSDKWPSRVLTSVSLGDGPNDLGMLASTDIAVVIAGRHKHVMNLKSQNRILTPAQAGPAGWNEAILTLLKEQ